MTEAEYLRAFGGDEHVAWMRWQPSIVSGRTPCVCAHAVTGGIGRRADADAIVPLTWAEHQEAHDHGVRTFEAKYGVDLRAAATDTEARYQNYLSRTVRPAW